MVASARDLGTRLGEEMRETILRVAIAAARSRDRLATDAGSALLFILAGSITKRGRHAEACALWRETIAELDAKKRPEVAVQAAIGLANALEKTGDRAAANAAYDDAVQRGRALDPSTHARMLANHGITLDERGDPNALAVLAEAAAVAERGSDAGSTLYVLSSWGIRLQHRSEYVRAAEVLRRARDIAPPMSPDALCVQDHLRSAESGKACECGKDVLPTYAEELSRSLAEALPAGLVESVGTGAGPDGKGLDVRMTRELTTDEAAILRLVIEQSRARGLMNTER
jgi:tetratricopeptide (TPR) repeat protein